MDNSLNMMMRIDDEARDHSGEEYPYKSTITNHYSTCGVHQYPFEWDEPCTCRDIEDRIEVKKAAMTKNLPEYTDEIRVVRWQQ